MKAKVTKNEILNSLDAIAEIESESTQRLINGKPVMVRKSYEVFFEYFLTRLKSSLEKEAKLIQEMNEKTLGEFRKKVQEINLKYAEKDDKGAPKIENNRYVFSKDNTPVWEKEQKDWETENKEKLDQFTAFMNEEVELDIHAVSFSRIENLVLPKGVVGILSPFFEMATN